MKKSANENFPSSHPLQVSEQQRVIAQASNAVSVVLQRPEQQGTPQHVEAEKLLLLASQKRQSALNEIQVFIWSHCTITVG